ncbi:Hypothetical predicted protein [Mytilus galloprovincialis]|uniref:Reverse transcriptase domain-containing protein n=1 Tax=Mytilus galloprovincialis TaxID=29158 RepID=A0A8B6D3X9_MYTGA|nr:Hypothetical predicted protein [Mytilus galloprovincialis]
MGASISCALWEKFAKALHWIIQLKSGNDDILHYLDDFLFVESSQTSKVGNTLKLFQEVCNKIGIPLASDKTTLPTTLLMFLGIEFDTQNLIMRLPNEKLVKLSQKIRDTLDSSKITLKDMQSLLGLLNFACKVVAPGRTFCRRLINSTIRDNVWVSNEKLELFTDSAGGPKAGMGSILQWGKFRSLAPEADQWPTKIPTQIWNILSQVADYIVNQGLENVVRGYGGVYRWVTLRPPSPYLIEGRPTPANRWGTNNWSIGNTSVFPGHSPW